MIEVRAWCSLPYQFEKTIPVGPGISDESLEILFDLPEAVLDHDNIFVTVKVGAFSIILCDNFAHTRTHMHARSMR